MFTKLLSLNALLLIFLSTECLAREFNSLRDAANFILEEEHHASPSISLIDSPGSVYFRDDTNYYAYDFNDKSITRLTCNGGREIESVSFTTQTTGFMTCIRENDDFFRRSFFVKENGKWELKARHIKNTIDDVPDRVRHYRKPLTVIASSGTLLLVGDDFLASFDNSWRVVEFKGEKHIGLYGGTNEHYALSGHELYIAKGYGEPGAYIQKVDIHTGEWATIDYFQKNEHIPHIQRLLKTDNGLLVMQFFIHWGRVYSSISSKNEHWSLKYFFNKDLPEIDEPVPLDVKQIDGEKYYLVYKKGLATEKDGSLHIAHNLFGLSTYVSDYMKPEKNTWVFTLYTGQILVWDEVTDKAFVENIFSTIE